MTKLEQKLQEYINLGNVKGKYIITNKGTEPEFEYISTKLPGDDDDGGKSGAPACATLRREY